MASDASQESQAHDGRALAFVHIPKTAGTSFTRILEQRFRSDQINPGYFHSDLTNIRSNDLGSYRLVRGHFYRAALARLLPPTTCYMTMLREPIARTLSQYTHLQTYVPNPPDAFGPEVDVEQYFFHPECALQAANVQTRYLGEPLDNERAILLQEGLAQETRRVLVGKWETAGAAQQALHEMCFFGLAERFDDSMALMSYTLGWHPMTRIKPLNVAPRRLSREQIPEHVLARIAELNREDIALYAFAEQLFQERYARMVSELLSEHYQRTVAASTPRLSRLRLRFDQPLPSGSMWYPPESDASGRVWRWTGPGRAASLDLPLVAGRDLVVRFGVLHAISPEVLASLELAVNQQRIALHARSGEAGETVFDGTMPADALADSLSLPTVTFQVSRTMAPRDLDPSNPDERLLGVALSWLEVVPAESARA